VAKVAILEVMVVDFFSGKTLVRLVRWRNRKLELPLISNLKVPSFDARRVELIFGTSED
jgi:hypothetical protein